MGWRTRLWYGAFCWLIKHGPPGGRRYCGNRVEHSWLCIPNKEVTVVIRDTRSANVHTREEIVRMLRTVRENEALMGWKCPEPFKERE